MLISWASQRHEKDKEGKNAFMAPAIEIYGEKLRIGCILQRFNV